MLKATPWRCYVYSIPHVSLLVQWPEASGRRRAIVEAKQRWSVIE
jgi:hypothetical protein